jgi:hypothetical protein
MKLARVLPLLLVAPLAFASSSYQVDVTGGYSSNWDGVRLTQQGNRVRGTYDCCGGGTIEGKILGGRILRYSWKQPGASGAGAWTIGDGRLDGTWGVGVDEKDGGRWDLVREPTIAQ